MTAIDPDIIGRWQVEGAAPTAPTYRVDADATYTVSDPEAPLSFGASGLTMQWGSVAYTKQLGAAHDLVGVWRNDRDGDEWYFRANGGVTVHWGPGDEYFGRYELRQGGASLWFEEMRGVLTTQAGVMHVDPPYGARISYGYVVTQGKWVWSDLASGAIMSTFVPV